MRAAGTQGELACGTPVRDAAAGETLSFTLQFVSASAALYRLLVVPDAGDPYVLAEHSDTQFSHMHRYALHKTKRATKMAGLKYVLNSQLHNTVTFDKLYIIVFCRTASFANAAAAAAAPVELKP